MLKIAHIQLLPLLSGVQNVSLKEIEFLKAEFDFSVVCKDDGPFTQKLREISVPVQTVNSLQREISVSKDLASLWELLTFFRKMNFDAIHTHSSKTGFIGRIAAKLTGCRAIIHTVHGFSFPAAKSRKAWCFYFLMEWIAKFCTHKLIVMNEADREFAINKLGYKDNKVEFLANGVDLMVFSTAHKEKISEQSKLKVVMVGRLWEQKDPKTLLDAAISILKKDRRFQFDFIGDGEYLENLQSQVNQQGLTDSIRFLGWQSDVPNLLPTYHLFVLPSKWEGMPLAILEAFACGLPVIATNIPGNRDLVADGTDGFLFEIGDATALEECLLRYRADAELLHCHGQSAREKVETKYDIKTRHTAISKIYRSMTAQG